MYDFLTLDCSAASNAKRVEGASDKPYAACDGSGQIKYILGPVAVPGSDLKTATAGLTRNSTGQTTGQWAVSLQFNEAGTEKFKDTSTILYASTPRTRRVPPSTRAVPTATRSQLSSMALLSPLPR